MLRQWVRHAVAAAALLVVPTMGLQAGVIQVCDTQPNIDLECKGCTPRNTNQTFALFDYGSQLNQLSKISQIQLTISMQVPDPAKTHLTLGLDGIDTGIQLTGFQKDTLVEKTFTVNAGDANWPSDAKMSLIQDALKDGQVFASVIGQSTDDMKLQMYSDTNVMLCFSGPTKTSGPEPVPEPASVLAWGVGIAALALRRRIAA